MEPPNLSEILQITAEGAGPGSTERRLPSLAYQESQSLILPGTAQSTDQIITAASLRSNFVAPHQTNMPYDYEGEAHAPRGLSRGHSRSRSGKGSNDKGRGNKPPSQKAMLSRALQKANTAVQLDNAQNFEGAREAYAEACELLRQVLHRTTGDEDKRKLEAIRRTYTSRIEELDQITPWVEEDTKALPARPNSDARRPDSESSMLRLEDEEADEVAVFETATITRVIGDDSRSPQPPHVVPAPSRRVNKPKPIVTTLNPEPGLLQSSFSRSPIHLGPPSPLLLQRPDPHYIPAPLSPRRPPSPPKAQEDALEEPVRAELAVAMTHPVMSTDPPSHVREDSLNSWLDPIDESGGSTSSSVHSRTSSLGFRRKHIRAASGTTEAEFDTALDAAIEAAYDEGYEPMSPIEYGTNEVDESSEAAVANALRKVEIARQRVRQTEREAQEILDHEMDRQWQPQPPLQQENHHYISEDFFDDNSSDEEERILEEMARDYGIEQFTMDHSHRPPVPRESDSSGRTTRTWHSSQGSNPPTAATSLSTVTEIPPFSSVPQGPAAPPPTTSLPELPQRPPSSAQSVRARRLSGQNAKQLKIETSKLGPSLTQHSENTTLAKSATTDGQDTGISTTSTTGTRSVTGFRRPSSPPLWEASPDDSQGPGSPFRHLGALDEDDNAVGRSASPNVTRLRKNFSSSSLRSMKSRNMSVSNLDENSDMSPGTPASNNAFGTARTPAIPALPTPLAAAFRDRLDTAGLSLFDDNFHSPTIPGSPSSIIPDVPVPLEPCPTDFMLRPFWLMRCLYQTLAHPRGGYLSNKLFVPREVWRVKGVKLKNIEDKVANCDFLTAALLKIAKVDTFDADAVLEEMQSLEGVLEQVQAALSRKLGNEVGVQGSGALFKDASNGADGDGVGGMPRSSSVSGKSAFSWRRLRSKNSAVGLGGAYTSRVTGLDAVKDVPSIPSLPMTAHPTSRPAKRDLTQAHFTGPNAMYMSSLARLFDAAQAIDQIARQVEDPGLRHADKTQVGLELCTRHAAEFFGFYVCRFVLSDLGLLLDKFIKRGSEWVMT